MITEERISVIDSYIESPEQRAERVYRLLQSTGVVPSMWDMICFCTQYMAAQHTNIPYMKDEIKRMSQFVYAQHYLFPESIDAQYNGPRSEFSRERSGNDGGVSAPSNAPDGSSSGTAPSLHLHVDNAGQEETGGSTATG